MTGAFDDALTLVSLFEDSTRAAPDAVAVVAGDRSLTYGELARRADGFADRMRAVAGPDRIIAIVAGTEAETLIAVLGVLKAGAAYFPLSPEEPSARLIAMLDEARPSAIVADPVIAAELPAYLRQRRVDLPSLDGDLDGDSDPARATVLPDNLAYLIATSGSTGSPKAVTVSHRAILHSLRARRQLYPVRPAVVCLTAPLTFDISVAQIFDTLGRGGTLVLGFDPLSLGTVSGAWTGAVRSAMLASFGYATLLAGDMLPFGQRVERVIVGGDALNASLVRQHFARFPQTALVNEYGPTEASVFSTSAWIDPDEDEPPIGFPIPGTAVYVLDERLQPCGTEERGEIYIVGEGLARGYHGRAGLTASRFVACPFAPGERMYRTGDRAHHRADGQLVFDGRADDQVKVRGVRIEPGEIATALLRLPGVAQAEVLGRAGADGEPLIVAYVVGTALDGDVLRALLAGALPGYMVPSAVLVLDALPLSANGKVDRAALAVPDTTGAEAAGASASGSPVEAVVCALVAELLGVAAARPSDDFFALGGHSLSAARLVARVRSVLGRVLEIRAVFEAPRLGDLAERVRLAPRADGALVPQERPGRVALSFAQSRLWFLERLGEGGVAYHITLAARLSGRLDAVALAAALDDVAGRHESLRTLLVEADGEPWQQVLEAWHVPWQRRQCAPDAVDRMLADFMVAPFELGAELPLRALLAEVGPDEHVLMLVVHHVAADGWSVGPLLGDLAVAYRARAAGEVPGWEPLPVQYADYALWQRELLGREDELGSVAGGQLAYWRDALAGLPAELGLPADRPRPVRPARTAGRVPVDLPGRPGGADRGHRPGGGGDAVHGAARRPGGAAVPAGRRHRHPRRHAGSRAR